MEMPQKFKDPGCILLKKNYENGDPLKTKQKNIRKWRLPRSTGPIGTPPMFYGIQSPFSYQKFSLKNFYLPFGHMHGALNIVKK